MSFATVVTVAPEIRGGHFYAFGQDVSERIPVGTLAKEVACKILKHRGGAYRVTLTYPTHKRPETKNITHLFSSAELDEYCKSFETSHSASHRRAATAPTGAYAAIAATTFAPPVARVLNIESIILPARDNGIFHDEYFDIAITNGILHVNGHPIRGNVGGKTLSIDHRARKIYIDEVLEVQPIAGELRYFTPEREKRIAIFEQLFAMRNYLGARQEDGEDLNFNNRLNHFVSIICTMSRRETIPDLDPAIIGGCFTGWRTRRYQNHYYQLLRCINEGVPFRFFGLRDSLCAIAEEFCNALQREAVSYPPSIYAPINSRLQAGIAVELAARARADVRADAPERAAFFVGYSTGLLGSGVGDPDHVAGR